MNEINYDSNGNTVPENDKNSVAKTKDSRFFIKKCNTGTNSGHFYDPNSLWNLENENKSFNSKKGKPIYQFVKVDAEIFELYLKYLKTKNPSHLRNAERLFLSC